MEISCGKQLIDSKFRLKNHMENSLWKMESKNRGKIQYLTIEAKPPDRLFTLEKYTNIYIYINTHIYKGDKYTHAYINTYRSYIYNVIFI